MSQAGDRSEAGYSLIELLFVLTVFSLISLIAVPTFQSTLTGLDERGAISKFADALRSARQLALTSNVPVRFVVDLNDNAYVVPGSPIGGRLPQTIKLKVRTALSEVLSDRRASLRFYPDGTSTGATIDLSLGNQSSAVSVNWLTGRVDMEER